MRFLDSYKRLEKLCGEIMNDKRGISAYIEEMENTRRGVRFVRGWERDLKQLKHYRWIRNQIVHDPGCTEENMCDPADAAWIEDFHVRIMSQTDPLTLYRKATQPRSQPREKAPKEPVLITERQNMPTKLPASPEKHTKQRKTPDRLEKEPVRLTDVLLLLMCAALVIAAIIIMYAA